MRKTLSRCPVAELLGSRSHSHPERVEGREEMLLAEAQSGSLSEDVWTLDFRPCPSADGRATMLRSSLLTSALSASSARIDFG